MPALRVNSGTSKRLLLQGYEHDGKNSKRAKAE
jgi:hypothetical protein